MAGTSFMITTITLFAIIVGINSETFKWNDYLVTRESSTSGGVRNFTQSLSRTVDGITSVDRTVELIDEVNNKTISIDYSITITNKSVVTFDRTLENFDEHGNLTLHDHFFNASRDDTVITGSNYTIWDNLGGKIIEYTEVTHQNNRDPTIHVIRESITPGNNLSEILHTFVIYRADGSREIYDNQTNFSSNLTFISNVVATIRKDDDQIVDFSETEIDEIDNVVTWNMRLVLTFRADDLRTVDKSTASMDIYTKNTKTERFFLMKDDEGGKNIGNMITKINADGKNSSSFREAKFDANDKCFSEGDTCSSNNFELLLSTAASCTRGANLLLRNANISSLDALKKFEDLMDKKNIRSET